MAANKINKQNLGWFVLLKASEGKSSREIALAIEQKFNVSLSYNTVVKYLKAAREKEDRSDPERNLRILDEQIEQLDAWRHNDGLDIGERLKVIREQRAAIMEKRRYCGAEGSEATSQEIDLFDSTVRRELLLEALNDKSD